MDKKLSADLFKLVGLLLDDPGFDTKKRYYFSFDFTREDDKTHIDNYCLSEILDVKDINNEG